MRSHFKNAEKTTPGIENSGINLNPNVERNSDRKAIAQECFKWEIELCIYTEWTSKVL